MLSKLANWMTLDFFDFLLTIVMRCGGTRNKLQNTAGVPEDANLFSIEIPLYNLEIQKWQVQWIEGALEIVHLHSSLYAWRVIWFAIIFILYSKNRTIGFFYLQYYSYLHRTTGRRTLYRHCERNGRKINLSLDLVREDISKINVIVKFIVDLITF